MCGEKGHYTNALEKCREKQIRERQNANDIRRGSHCSQSQQTV